MNLGLVDLRLAAPFPPTVPTVPHAQDFPGWIAQLQRAGSDNEAPERAAPESAETQLESCGIPLAPAEAAPVRVAAPPVSHVAAGESAPPLPGPGPVEQRPSLRVHVQADAAEGLKVWLGIDGDAALVAQRAGVAVADLCRSLQQPAGARVVSVICNGVPVYPRASLDSSLLKEAPWPSDR
ncbi:hypothetical protein GCM10028796_40880 [Ramlibacter monticola]|uniref:Uncharacterized protein n=1 Tax=Ramlibacter monticola TaxID=1926872 RepID=A0A936Z4L4_9BURK|nr:hypothetical protein [Ramlibacter monticola]MBL0393502.1 hypothetical protein [Ramlibacter monticola]